MGSAFAERLKRAVDDEAGRLIVADAPPAAYLDSVEWLLGRLRPDASTRVYAPPLSFREVEKGPLPGASPDPIPGLPAARRLGVRVSEMKEVPARVGAVTVVVLDADNLLEGWQRHLFRRAGGETRIVLIGCSERPDNRPRTFLEMMEEFSKAPFARIVRPAAE